MNMSAKLTILGARAATIVLAILLVVNQPTPSIAALEDDRWREVQSDNFVILTNGRKNEVRALAEDLEYFRASVQLLFDLKSADSELPLTIVAVRRNKDFKEFFPLESVAGFFVPTLRGHYAVIDLSAREISLNSKTVSASRPVLLHEYVHFLLRNNSTVRYPGWYEEGFAEYLSTLTYEDGAVEIGRPIMGRMFVLSFANWMGLDELLSARVLNAHVDAFSYYAQAWLLVHHLNTDPDLKPRLEEFLKRYSNGEDQADAVFDVFGVTLEELQTELVAKAKNGKYDIKNIALAAPLPKPKITLRTLKRTEKWLRLAEVYRNLGITQDSNVKAAKLYEKVLRKKVNAPRALAGLADIAISSGDLESAAKILGKADVKSDSVPLLIANGDLTYALALIDAANHVSIPRPALRTARGFYLDALRRNPDSAEAYYSYGLTYLGSHEVSGEGAKAFRQAHLHLPTSTAITIMRAMTHLQNGEYKQARGFAEEVALWTRIDAEREVAEEIVSLSKRRDGSTVHANAFDLARGLFLRNLAVPAQ
jgi:tetratricopeptide (TPR) repeat protein